VIASDTAEATIAFLEIGLIVLVLAVLARVAARLGITAVPLYLVVGLVVGQGDLLDVGEDFVALAAEMGVLLLLLALGLEYTDAELRSGLRSGLRPGVFDMAANAVPGVVCGLLLGWSPLGALLLGGVTWVSSSGIVAKVLTDLGRLGNRETPTVLNLLVIEDLAMAVYLPVMAALVVGGSLASTTVSVVIAVGAVTVILLLALRYGIHFSRVIDTKSDESLLFAVFGVTLVVAGLAQRIEVSGAIGAFLVGLALSGGVEERAMRLIGPLRDLFAATFFVFFAFQIELDALVDSAPVAVVLAVVTAATKVATGWYGARLAGVGPRGRLRAGTVLIARGEFSIVIAALGSGLADGPDLTAVAAGYVLVTAMIGPVLTRFADRLPLPATRARSGAAVVAS
jgi:CPA2 family monovalent cation:H+ antiporter-2